MRFFSLKSPRVKGQRRASVGSFDMIRLVNLSQETDRSPPSELHNSNLSEEPFDAPAVPASVQRQMHE